MAKNSPKHSVQTWIDLRLQFEAGSYKTLKELALSHGVHPSTLRRKICMEKWNEKQSALLSKVEQKLTEGREEQVQKYLKKSFLVAETYEKLVKVSMEQLSGKDSQGNHIIDPDSLDTYSKISQRSFEMGKSALRIPDVSQVDVSGKVSIEHSLVATIAKLREAKEKPALTSEDVSKYIDVEILPKASGSS